jgi:hypothetical protein
MEAELFYTRLLAGAGQPPAERHAAYADLHADVVRGYVEALRHITPAAAQQPLREAGETRTLAQVVGHIAAWEQFALLAAGDILAGVRHPRMVTSVDGFVDADGKTLNFAGIHAFNAYHAARHAELGWEQLHALALDTARALHTLFTHPRLLTAGRLEDTLPYQKRLHNGALLENLSMGWHVWLTVLEHEAVEHAEALSG